MRKTNIMFMSSRMSVRGVRAGVGRGSLLSELGRGVVIILRFLVSPRKALESIVWRGSLGSGAKSMSRTNLDW